MKTFQMLRKIAKHILQHKIEKKHPITYNENKSFSQKKR